MISEKIQNIRELYTQETTLQHSRPDTGHTQYYSEWLELKLNTAMKKIDRYESGSMKSLCNVTADNKRLFRIALRRKYPKFSSTSQFVKWCVKQVTGMDFKEFLEIGR